MENDWTVLSPEEKKKQLFRKQKELLDGFLSRNAITPAQYRKSLGDLTEKMGMREELEKMRNSAEEDR